MPEWGNATLLEAVWTAMALWGIGLDGRLSYFIARSRARLRAQDVDDLRLSVNKTRQRGRNGHLQAYAVLFLIGVVAMFTPQPIAESNQDAATLSSLLLIYLLGRMLYDTLFDSRDRQMQLGQVLDQVLGEIGE